MLTTNKNTINYIKRAATASDDKVAKMPANMHIFHATGIYRHLWNLWQIWWQIWHIW